MKSSPSHITSGSHGSSQCSFYLWNGACNRVIIAGSGTSTIRSYTAHTSTDTGFVLSFSAGALLLRLSLLVGVLSE